MPGFWVTVQPYTAQSDDEISYDAGEDVELLATSNFGWWKIRWGLRTWNEVAVWENDCLENDWVNEWIAGERGD